jgi:hypothetical protein
MKPIIQKIKIYKLVTLLFCMFAMQLSYAQTLPLKCYENQHDYSFMWWTKTIKTGNQVFAIKTNKYSLLFDYQNLVVQDFSINHGNVPETSVLWETNAESFSQNQPCELNFGLSINGNMQWCKTTSGSDDDCQLIETGKYFQRRFITNLPDLQDCNRYNSGLEISSWPDRLTFILKITPEKDLENLELVTNLKFPEKYSVVLENSDLKALKNPSDGSGFIFLKSAEATAISVTGTTVQVSRKEKAICKKGEELNSGIIIYPIAANIDSRIIEIATQENQPLIVSAQQITPKASKLDVTYDKDKGWHQVMLRSDRTESKELMAEPGESNFGPQDDLNNRMERVRFSVKNSSSTEKVLRLSFAKGRLFPGGAEVFGTPGISAVLRDADGNPIGIPIQLSKNWHTGGRSGVEDHYFRGTWYHGLSELTVPAKSSITLEYTSVNSMWGGVPAASHAQLCLIGWGHNQQWDESAIGAWGESITYEPDLDQADAPLLDYRPLLVKTLTNKKWGWTGNNGGADFFNYTKIDGTRGWHSRIRTQYKKYSPNLTEVTYAGTMDDNSMDFQYTASIGRSDDLNRGIYKLSLKVLKDISFNDFVFFQAAAANYHFVQSNTLAWGNETGLKKEWKATMGEEAKYFTEKQVAEGDVPWFSFTESEYNTGKHQQSFLPANRGFVIRKWKAKINGIENTPPYFAEYNAKPGGFGGSSSLINITPPEGCTSFKTGDYIEAEIELFLIPKFAEDYYGPNQNLKKALTIQTNTWKMVYREAIGNNIEVEVSKGTLLNNYPIKIKAENGEAHFAVSGGLGYVPLTITDIPDYKNPELFQKINRKWEKVNQEVHGNDFWQTEFDALSGTWDITYNINLDTPNDIRQTIEYRFGK